MKKSDLPRT